MISAKNNNQNDGEVRFALLYRCNHPISYFILVEVRLAFDEQAKSNQNYWISVSGEKTKKRCPRNHM